MSAKDGTTWLIGKGAGVREWSFLIGMIALVLAAAWSATNWSEISAWIDKTNQEIIESKRPVTDAEFLATLKEEAVSAPGINSVLYSVKEHLPIGNRYRYLRATDLPLVGKAFQEQFPGKTAVSVVPSYMPGGGMAVTITYR